MAKKKKSKNKINIFSLIISLILICTSIYLSDQGVIRPLLWIISIIILSINIVNSFNIKFTKIVIIFLTLFILSIFVDSIIVITFKRIPVFAYNVISTRKTIVYNGIGVRAWQCDKNNYNDIVIDLFYNKGYICNAEDIDVIDSNSFLNSVVENYQDYKNSYIKINGKISKKTGQNYIEMRPYEKTDVTLNGYVAFADNITLRILFNENSEELDNYDVYDEITIVGIVKNLESEDGKHIIYMYDSKVLSTVNLNDYTISATTESSCTTDKNIIYSNETTNIYTHCLENIIVTYPNDSKYELSYILSSNKINVNQLHKKYLSKETSQVDDSIMYKFENYNLLICDKKNSKDMIYGPKNMKFDDVKCDLIVEE